MSIIPTPKIPDVKLLLAGKLLTMKEVCPVKAPAVADEPSPTNLCNV